MSNYQVELRDGKHCVIASDGVFWGRLAILVETEDEDETYYTMRSTSEMLEALENYRWEHLDLLQVGDSFNTEFGVFRVGAHDILKG